MSRKMGYRLVWDPKRRRYRLVEAPTLENWMREKQNGG